MEDLQRQIQELKKQLNDLSTKYDNLCDDSTIPLNIDQAFRSRLGGGSSGLYVIGTGGSSAGSTTIYNAFPVTVPANPSGCITVTWNGQTYNLLYK